MSPDEVSSRSDLADLRRDQIIAEAGRLFGSRGTTDVSMDEIATAAGVARSTVYVYFATRQELIAACIGDMEHQMRTKVAAIESTSPIVSLTMLFEALLDTVDSQPAFFRLVLAANGTSSGVGRVVTEQLTGIAGSVSSHIEQLLQLGHDCGLWHLEDQVRSARLIGQLIYGTLAVRSLGFEHATAAEESVAMTELIVGGLAAGLRAGEISGASRVGQR